MKLGLLKCDFVPPEFRDIDGGIPDMFRRLLDDAGLDADLRVYRVWEGELPASTAECDGWLTSGARASVFEDEEWIKNLEDFVRALHADERKTVGICFGHQMIAQALGGETQRAETGWGIGAQDVTLHKTHPWMQPPMENCRLLFTHQDQVTRLPEGAQLLGSAAHCPNAMFTLGDHILATQAHPEYSRPYLRALIKSREAIIDPITFKAGLSSLQLEHHRDEIAQWLCKFLRA
tara:strand:- start:151 stop:852 length:702 start_codon:yes stop_codon:yes gene_type:complete